MSVRRRPSLAIAALLAFLSGCYNYDPWPTPSPRPGTHVTALLTDSGTSALSSYLGPDVGAVDGQLVTATDQQVIVSVLAVHNRNGIAHYWRGEPVTLPRSDIASLSEKKLAVVRTAVFVAAGVTGALLALRAFGAIGPGILGGGPHQPAQ